ncbi:hypothetical protein TTHERM_00476420 (macronuclear) [Tetrahymena thermophila SB210]|uniref:Uncharacterized protein n=1 Tax=Tetrahymena thermophila (strain SB210) TaxID=312017 RepID=I7MEK9_TETTS|nr:hypothetical protein TTHERM_00476420 [Tetrahymena thermophila SB210]EAR97105.1 hypothetical protein TTHERM_00476420 [Tetrahymena thermophila SB210]|eukprot:XP_001017350.1 hypothetical protein TTHERM_00476420 [Tetrahymena thermophila SB210]
MGEILEGFWIIIQYAESFQILMKLELMIINQGIDLLEIRISLVYSMAQKKSRTYSQQTSKLNFQEIINNWLPRKVFQRCLIKMVWANPNV